MRALPDLRLIRNIALTSICCLRIKPRIIPKTSRSSVARTDGPFAGGSFVRNGPPYARPGDRIDPLTPGGSTRRVLQNILFFAKDPALVKSVFDAAFRFVAATPVRRLTFLPDARVWELIV